MLALFCSCILKYWLVHWIALLTSLQYVLQVSMFKHAHKFIYSKYITEQNYTYNLNNLYNDSFTDITVYLLIRIFTYSHWRDTQISNRQTVDMNKKDKPAGEPEGKGIDMRPLPFGIRSGNGVWLIFMSVAKFFKCAVPRKAKTYMYNLLCRKMS